MRIASTQTFTIEGSHDLGEIARLIGSKVGGKFIADTPNDVLNGYVTQQIDTMDDGTVRSHVTVYFYDEDESPIVPETTLDTDPEEVKQMKRRRREMSHSNPFKKMVLSKSKELAVGSIIDRIKEGKIKVRTHEQAIEESKKAEPTRRQEYFDQLKKQKPLQKPSIPLD